MIPVSHSIDKQRRLEECWCRNKQRDRRSLLGEEDAAQV